MEVAAQIVNLGFSVFVAVYLLRERSGAFKEFTAAINKLSSSIERLLDKGRE